MKVVGDSFTMKEEEGVKEATGGFPWDTKIVDARLMEVKVRVNATQITTIADNRVKRMRKDNLRKGLIMNMTPYIITKASDIANDFSGAVLADFFA